MYRVIVVKTTITAKPFLIVDLSLLLVMFMCEFEFRPQDVLSSVCGSNGQWQPDPGLHDCTG